MPHAAQPAPAYASLEAWIAAEAIPFSLNSPGSLDTAVGKLVAGLGDSVDLLGFGEALHGGEDILILRNRLFQRLAEAYGFSAIAIESSFTRGRIINEYVNGHGPDTYDAVQETGFSHGFGRLDANRELVEWMRRYNGGPARDVKLQFYGFDTPTEMMFGDSPRQALRFVLDYVASVDNAAARAHRQRIEPLLGQDADWENPAAITDPAQSIGRSPVAAALRAETEDLISELHMRRPEWGAVSGQSRYQEAAHYASVARQLLNYHAEMAIESADRVVRLLGMRDTAMADNLAYIVSHERGRGKVLAFAHNSHLKCGQARWLFGTEEWVWWPAGAHVAEMLGPRYAVIGSAVGVSDENGIGPPEAGTLEALLTAGPSPALFIPTHMGERLPAPVLAELPLRSGSVKNQSYFPLLHQSLTDFDWLAALDSASYTRGGPPLPEIDSDAGQ